MKFQAARKFLDSFLMMHKKAFKQIEASIRPSHASSAKFGPTITSDGLIGVHRRPNLNFVNLKDCSSPGKVSPQWSTTCDHHQLVTHPGAIRSCQVGLVRSAASETEAEAPRRRFRSFREARGVGPRLSAPPPTLGRTDLLAAGVQEIVILTRVEAYFRFPREAESCNLWSLCKKWDTSTVQCFVLELLGLAVAHDLVHLSVGNLGILQQIRDSDDCKLPA